jgi:hypothetical protein
MGRYASEPESLYTPAPAGTHVARCFRIVDIGTHSSEYQGKPTRRNQIIIAWELPNETIKTEDGAKPIVASRFYTNSLSEKASLRQDLESWRGRGFSADELHRFDLENILGKPCLLTIVGGENGKTKIANVSGLPKGMDCPEQVNESFTFWLDDFSEEKFSTLTEGLQKLVKQSEEYPQIMNGEKPGTNGYDRDIHDDLEDIPF